eukprot:1157229-Pelagomonas_calceolata.AAC.6
MLDENISPAANQPESRAVGQPPCHPCNPLSLAVMRFLPPTCNLLPPPHKFLELGLATILSQLSARMLHYQFMHLTDCLQITNA